MVPFAMQHGPEQIPLPLLTGDAESNLTIEVSRLLDSDPTQATAQAGQEKLPVKWPALPTQRAFVIPGSLPG